MYLNEMLRDLELPADLPYRIFPTCVMCMLIIVLIMF